MPPRSCDGYASDMGLLIPRPDVHRQPDEAFQDRRAATFEQMLGGHKRQEEWQNPAAPQIERAESLLTGGLLSASSRHCDVIIYVGKNRTPYMQSVESLKRSSYFRSLLEKRSYDPSFLSPSIVVDCDETVFQNMMTILRYGTFEALPKMPEHEMLKLRKELACYGIEVPSNKSSSPISSPTPSSPLRRNCVMAGSSQHFSLAELPDFPKDLLDPTRLVLVSRLDDDVRGRCVCAIDERPSQWALNFFYRHAFCTACGMSTSGMPAKFVAEMFMAAASYYSQCDVINLKKWSVICDSTCTLKFLSAGTCCTCSCSKQTVWGVSTYYSHAFCTQCGKCAEDRALVCILLRLRYGSLYKSPKGKRDHVTDFVTISREPPILHTAPTKGPGYGI